MRLVFRPSKLHPSSSGLTIRSRDRARCIVKKKEKKNHRQDPSRKDRSLVSVARAYVAYGFYISLRRENDEKNQS